MTSLQHNIGESLNRDYVALMASGSFAIFTALKALAFPAGSDIIMPAICCPAVLSAIQLAGHNAVIADVDADSYSMEAANVQAVFTSNCKAVIAVHAYGRPCNMAALSQVCKDKGMALIEDACLAYGNHCSDGPVGSFGDISLISFGYDKPIHCGDGGAIMTNDVKLYDEINTMITANPMLDISATAYDFVQEKWGELEGYVNIRKDNTDKYLEAISLPWIKTPKAKLGYWRLPLLVNSNRDDLVHSAAKAGIIITTHYRSLSGLSSHSNTPIAEHIDRSIINAFIRPGTTSHEINSMVNFLNGYNNG